MKITRKEIETLLWVLRELLTVLLQLKKNNKKDNEKEQD